jgi:hypothetical protein
LISHACRQAGRHAGRWQAAKRECCMLVSAAHPAAAHTAHAVITAAHRGCVGMGVHRTPKLFTDPPTGHLMGSHGLGVLMCWCYQHTGRVASLQLWTDLAAGACCSQLQPIAHVVCLPTRVVLLAGRLLQVVQQASQCRGAWPVVSVFAAPFGGS